MVKEKVKLDLLFETSWEVCNKVGGIYTVLSTKAKTLGKIYKDKVIFIGPDVWDENTPSPYFIEEPTAIDCWKINTHLPYGITIRTGHWDIPGKPIAVLVGFNTMYALNNDLYGEMWEQFRVDSLHAYGDYGEACAFSHAAGVVIESICSYFGTENRNIIAHFDEWTTGMALLYTKLHLPSVATVFTTHATSIGRSICGNGKLLYEYLPGYNGDQMSRELNMEAKHSLEKAAAHNADCFTTVSDITAIECTQLLERRPDVVTPNGFEANFVPAASRFAATRKRARRLLIDTASSLTGKQYPDNALIVATSGRCEYRNKGLDLFLDSIAEVSRRNPQRPVISYIMVPAWVKEPRADLMEAIAHKTTEALPDPVITHYLNNPESDSIINNIHRLGFSNNNMTSVDVIYVPCYLNGNDGIFNKSYYDLLIGMDLTVFPSYYEPWGYTPLESIAFGVPTVTTSLSGFGQWILHESASGFLNSGVEVVPRTDTNYREVVSTIADNIMEFDNMPTATANEISEKAKATARTASWTNFIKHYIDCYAIALDNNKKLN